MPNCGRNFLLGGSYFFTALTGFDQVASEREAPPHPSLSPIKGIQPGQTWACSPGAGLAALLVSPLVRLGAYSEDRTGDPGDEVHLFGKR
jgi:hypothetical protein